MQTVEPGPVAADIVDSLLHRAKTDRETNLRYVGSGKAALRLVFGHLQRRRVLENKMAPILVPPWLGTWVYNELLPWGFPDLSAANARVVLVYHQYGFSQDMDRVLEMAHARHMIVVEDCAHAAASFYKGRPLGTFGEYAIFSYSKFAFCFPLGGVTAKSPEFDDYINEVTANPSFALRLFVSAVKIADEFNLHRERPIGGRMTNGLTRMAYARYGDQSLAGSRAIALWLKKREMEIEARRENYALLRRHIASFGICDHLEPDGVVPYAVPLAISRGKVTAVINALHEQGIDATLRRFDFARCMFEPDYRECVLVPIHSQMTGQGMEKLIAGLTAALTR